MITSFAVPSITTSCPGWMRPLASCRPTTAGTSSERARMAVWYVRLPASVAKPRTFVQSTCAASDGVSSSAIRTDASSIARSRSRGARHALPQIHAQASDEIGDVAFALAQIGIGDLVEDGAELVEDLLHRPLGVHELLANERLSARHEHRIVEHQQLRVEQRRRVRARAAAQSARGCRAAAAATAAGSAPAVRARAATRTGAIRYRRTCAR